MNGTHAGVYAYTSEVHPTALRARLRYRLVGDFYPRAGFAGVFGTMTAVLLVGAIALLVLDVPTRGRSLETIAASEFGNRAAAVS